MDSLDREIEEMSDEMAAYTVYMSFGSWLGGCLAGWGLKHYGYKRTFVGLVVYTLLGTILSAYLGMEYLPEEPDPDVAVDASTRADA